MEAYYSITNKKCNPRQRKASKTCRHAQRQNGTKTLAVRPNPLNLGIWAKHAATDGDAFDKQVAFKYDAWGTRIEMLVNADEVGAGSVAVPKFAANGWNPPNWRAPAVMPGVP